jgi:hypothetical protein
MRQKLVNCIRDQNYKDLIDLLQMDASMVDQGLFTLAKMTGLEWAVYWEDWKMTAIFFIFGADPKNNIFDGVMEMPPGYSPLPGFAGGRPIPGFDGLILLLATDEEEDLEYGMAYLSVMQVCYNGGLDVRLEFGPLLQSLYTIRDDLKLIDLKERVRTSLMCLRRVGLSNDIAIRIVTEMLIGSLWGALRDHAFSEPVRPSDELPWKGLVESSASIQARSA